MALGMTLAHWVALSPAIAYFGTAFFYDAVDALGLFPQHRIRPSDEECKKNLTSRSHVFRHMVVYHAIGTALLLVGGEMSPPPVAKPGSVGTLEWFAVVLKAAFEWERDSSAVYYWSWILRAAYLAARQFAALVFLDTWVFWCHYFEHQIPWLYRKIHSVHHQLYTPFPMGALYNHPAESIVSDSMGGLLASIVVRMTGAEQIVFFSLVTMKTVEDHAPFELPWSPFVIFAQWTGAGVVYHNIHHQTWGLKSNYQVYFTYWDRWMNTTYKGTRTLNDKAQTSSAESYPKSFRENGVAKNGHAGTGHAGNGHMVHFKEAMVLVKE
ncbi:hypothetical protein QBC34DRAFT_424629 [Podospora aff. communis PSN243]|uniref:Fatty acid hydroxylase domain-containing protein n=1 Tax=Podospora aff. communis PSN243 TaxID=3040156 RepID=A0AAV9GRB0_9PEZI|nr:hypothetical protein QBC34DRAFT_424629 [Podospora aff. communis PSN243]